MLPSSEAKVVKADKGVKIGESSSALQKSSFENLPTEVRLEIYRGLLLTEEEYVDPVTAGKHLSRSFGHQGSGKGLHVAILRCNKRIHGEANGVLYGENIFHSGLLSRLKFKLWHRFSMEEGSAVISSRCLRLITKVHLTIYLPDSFGVNEVVLAIDIVRRNLNDVASELALNDLTVLSIRFTNALTDGWFPTLRRMPETMDPSATSPFYGQECLEPLLEFRATSFVLESTHVAPDMAAKLKATIEGSTIEGPKHASLLPFLQLLEDEKRRVNLKITNLT